MREWLLKDEEKNPVGRPSGFKPEFCLQATKLCRLGSTDKELADTLGNVKLEKVTANTIVSKEVLYKHLEKVKQDGFALDQEEIEEGLSCIAAPIKNHRGKVIAGISVSGPSSRMRSEILGELKDDVMDKALQISRRLGYKE